tara:strand:- start:389 stop:802 length:414 start_codon:yes stop_codon:yes gene_type:complete
MSRLKTFVAMAGLGAVVLSMLATPYSKAEMIANNSDRLAIMTFKQWDDVKDNCVVEGTEVYSRLGNAARWEKKAQLWDKECVKKTMKERGYANAVVFDPDEMSDFKKKICDLYETSVVSVDGVVVERKFGSAFEKCQ